MVLSDENIADFKKLYLKQFGKELTNEEAYEQAIRLICLVKAVYKPIPKQE